MGKAMNGASEQPALADVLARLDQLGTSMDRRLGRIDSELRALRAQIPSAGASDLDQLHSDLNKALTQVERMRAKAARKAAASTPKAAPKKVPAPDAKDLGIDGRPRKKGDLRGL